MYNIWNKERSVLWSEHRPSWGCALALCAWTWHYMLVVLLDVGCHANIETSHMLLQYSSQPISSQHLVEYHWHMMVCWSGLRVTWVSSQFQYRDHLGISQSKPATWLPLALKSKPTGLKSESLFRRWTKMTSINVCSIVFLFVSSSIYLLISWFTELYPWFWIF